MNALHRWLLIFSISCSCFWKVYGWNSAGHMIIASMAYRELSSDKKKVVTEILTHHPAFETWAHIFQDSDQGVSFGEFLMMRAATWPDEIRRKGGATAQFDHPDWHFVDYPLQPMDFPEKPGPKPDDDVLFGIKDCLETLNDDSSDSELQAVSLSWLIHLAGDIHQPLHCSSLFNDSFKHGDKGGNLFFIKPGTKPVKLHSFWDGLLGKSTNPRANHNTAIQLKSTHSKTSLQPHAGETAPLGWSEESRLLAIDAYQKGKLPGSPDSRNVPDLPRTYPGECKKVAERQAALAGYRLAAVISAEVATVSNDD